MTYNNGHLITPEAEMETCHDCEQNFDYTVEGGSNQEGNPLCDACLREIQTACCICEEDFFIPEKPEETFLHIKTGNTAQVGLPEGIYKVIKYPWFLGNVVTGFEYAFPDAVERIAPSITRGSTGTICHYCFTKYTTSK